MDNSMDMWDLLEFHSGRIFEFFKKDDSLTIIITGESDVCHQGEFWYRCLGSKMANIGILEEHLLGNLKMPPINRSNVGDRINEAITQLKESGVYTVSIFATLNEGSATVFWMMGSGNALAQRAATRKVLQSISFGLPLCGESES